MYQFRQIKTKTKWKISETLRSRKTKVKFKFMAPYDTEKRDASTINRSQRMRDYLDSKRLVNFLTALGKHNLFCYSSETYRWPSMLQSQGRTAKASNFLVCLDIKENYLHSNSQTLCIICEGVEDGLIQSRF